MGLTDDVLGKIGCHYAWADSPVNDLSEVGFDGSGIECPFGGCALTRVYNVYIYIYICVMLVFEYSHGSKGRAQRTVIDVIVTGNWH